MLSDREKLQNLANVLVEGILNLSDEEILREEEEDRLTSLDQVAILGDN
jgi:hypothetical protein